MSKRLADAQQTLSKAAAWQRSNHRNPWGGPVTEAQHAAACGELVEEIPRVLERLRFAEVQRDLARRSLNAVHALHLSRGRDTCEECGQQWPCRTFEAMRDVDASALTAP